MRTIYKYAVTPGPFTLVLPVNARALSFNVQQGEPQLWVFQDTIATLEQRHFVAIGTGHRIHDDALLGNFIGTFLLAGSGLVFHLFEVDKQ